MRGYILEVIAPFVIGSQSEDADLLSSALDAVATIYGAVAVESSAVPKKRNQRKYVNILDCANTLEKEIEWLRKTFPTIRFILKESKASQVGQRLRA